MSKFWPGEVGTLKGAFESENVLGKVLGTVGLDRAELVVVRSFRRRRHRRHFVPGVGASSQQHPRMRSQKLNRVPIPQA